MLNCGLGSGIEMGAKEFLFSNPVAELGATTVLSESCLTGSCLTISGAASEDISALDYNIKQAIMPKFTKR